MQKIEFTNTKNQKLFDAILGNNPNLNYQILNQLLRKKDIRVNGQKILQNSFVQNGDRVTFFLPDKKQKVLDIAYEDEQLIVVFKPQGLETTKADKTFLQTDCVEDIFEGAFACHRLDKNTEGLLVLAKNKQARDIMFECFKNHNVQKFYKAICYGNIKEQETFVDYHKKQNNKVYIFSEQQKETSKAITSYIKEKQNENFCLLDINIKTGKTHQIRAQLAHHKIYVLGDERYGNKQINKQFCTKKQQLCAYKLVFTNMPKQFAYLNQKHITTEPTFLKKYGF